MSDGVSVEGLSDDERRTVGLLRDQLRSHERSNRKRSRFYDGRNAVRQFGDVIPRQYTRLGLALGWAAKPVDGLARRCNLDRVLWTGGGR